MALAGLKSDGQRLALGKILGAECIFDGGAEETLQKIQSQGDGLGVDVVIDASGHSSSLQLALKAVRPGGQITKVGWGPQPLDSSLDLLVKKAVRIQGSFSHNFVIWEKVIALLASGQLDPTLLTNRVDTLANWRACFEEMAAGRAVKNVLKPNAL